MSYSMVVALLFLSVGGFLWVSVKALELRYKQWQLQRFLRLFISEPIDMVQNKSGLGGGAFAIFWFALMVVIAGLFFFS